MVAFKSEGNSIFGITVDRKQTLKLLFPQEKATLHAPLKVYMYSENALIARKANLSDLQTFFGLQSGRAVRDSHLLVIY
jgi:hypothetical protein